jgi:carboxypeptidase C (cathepsin A)
LLLFSNNTLFGIAVWLFEPAKMTVDDSLVIWFNGGPGCSSFHAGLLMENGPVTIPLHPAGYFGQTKNETYGPNPYSWTNVTTMLYVEQPVGTGFSYGKEPPNDEEGVSSDFYGFLLHFYRTFPHHATKRLFLVGESYAGYYVPSIAHYIYNQNKKHTTKTPVPLAGIALGNGWADVNIQGPMVIDYAWWHGMIDSVTRDALHEEWQHCSLKTGKEPSPFHPFTVPDECGIMGATLQAAGAGLLPWGAPNTYDVTTFDPYLILTNHDSTNYRFFNIPQVQKALNVPKEAVDGKPWMGCIPGEGRRARRSRRLLLAEKKTTQSTFDVFWTGVRRMLGGDEPKLLLDDDRPMSMVPYIADLLDKAGIQVLVYNGDRDMSTCAQGSEMLLNSMKWSSAADWVNPNVYRRGLWMVNEEVAGYAKTLQNLDFVVVSNSGHLVPYNQPAVALDLIARFLKQESFINVDIPVVYQTQKGVSQSSMIPHSANKSSLFTTATLVATICGFVVGVLAVYGYSSFQRRNYDRLGDVEIESQG